MRRLLIANRGEIAVRIVRTCKRLGIRTIGVFSDADARASHVAEADEAYRIGPSPASESYLNIEAILGVARRAGAQAIHPGYGCLVENAADFEDALQAAQRESQASFGDAHVLLERYVRRPRHVEVQILGDLHGHLVHLGERECSIQRRHQKLVEESPSPAVDPERRRRMGEAALQLARAARYANAGTVEFLIDEQDGQFAFLEVNARLQVEHPVTEAVTGLDLVELQLRVA